MAHQRQPLPDQEAVRECKTLVKGKQNLRSKYAKADHKFEGEQIKALSHLSEKGRKWFTKRRRETEVLKLLTCFGENCFKQWNKHEKMSGGKLKEQWAAFAPVCKNLELKVFSI